MANISRNFTAGKMNKVVDERLVPNGQYIDAMNVRMGSTEQSEIGVIENTKGNVSLTALAYINGIPLSAQARCIGAYADGANETIYWFVHDPNFQSVVTGKFDLIVSYNTLTTILTYHVISVNDGTDLFTTLNFNPNYLITAVNKIGDLLFFSDDYNPPRFINVLRTYPSPDSIQNIDAGSISGADLLRESLLVIKRPPVEAPTVQLIKQGDDNNYLEDRFISFAYRYKYIDGEYSATSQWSDIAFAPGDFDFSANSYLNEGMQNAYNTAIVSYNTGGPLVVGIDILFKQADNNIIKVIDKFDKAQLGFPNDTIQTFSFNNSKIFTVLSEGEILRLYDNVPRLAKAQTIMGNRLMYGNYVEGYDLITKYNTPTRLEYETQLISQVIDYDVLPDNKISSEAGNYSFGSGGSINSSVVSIDFTGVPLTAGSSIDINVTLGHGVFYGNTPLPTETPANFDVSFTFILINNYSSVYAMASSVEFQEAVGTAFNILPVFSPIVGDQTSCDGSTFTDQFNCAVPATLITPNTPGSVTKYQSGITADLEPIAILISTSSSIIKFQFPAIRFVDDTAAPTQSVYWVAQFKEAEVSYQSAATSRSLHSNRGYEVGIVYMDEFGRSTTALVSPYNTEFVPCGFSSRKNSIQVSIPVSQIAPWWAKRYKFVCKADQHSYNTIYSSIFFTDSATGDKYFLLEGENMRKVEIGDRYIVKRDTSGPLNNCVYATVLDKGSKSSGFITAQGGVVPPAGVYMKMKPEGFQVNLPAGSVIDSGEYTVDQDEPGQYPYLTYPLGNYSVPAGSIIQLYFKFQRLGTGDGNNKCERRIYTLDVTLTSSQNYANMRDWWLGDHVSSILNSGTQEVGEGGCPIQNYFVTGEPPFSGEPCNNYYGIGTNLDGTFYLAITGTNRCDGVNAKDKRRSSVTAHIVVLRANNLLIFETEPTDTLPDVFYENNLSFPIDSAGNHLSNGAPGDISQDITLGIPAQIDTGFFNCFTFGNGAESYRVRDSIVGRTFDFGQRVMSVSAQDYKEADRFSDITYSGVYNQETNVNKLNEFNLGLLNFKNLERSFGEIQVLDGRETDVLNLQEDKISYVLAGKNLLSDAAAGSALTSVPEVLGTQIARAEKYGITFNPESYVQWGYDRFFTDAKRGAVIQLKGNAYSNEQLNVISEMGMRTWFRDRFINSFNTQKIGGFDPYMNEYVLSMNDIEIPGNPQCLQCGKVQTLSLSNDTEEYKTLNFCVDLGPVIGGVDVNWNVLSIGEGSNFSVTVTYNSQETTSGTVYDSGSINFSKDSITQEIVYISIMYMGVISLSVNVDCPIGVPLNVIEVVLTSDIDAGKSIHTQFRYTDGFYVGPLQSNQVSFINGSSPIVSRYNLMTGFVGTGLFPPEGSTMVIQTNKIAPDNYNFQLYENSFRVLRTTTLLENNPSDINTLLISSGYVPPVLVNPNLFSGTFTVPSASAGDYLYLVWDLRNKNVSMLCNSLSGDEGDLKSLCCDCVNCSPDISSCVTWSIENVSSNPSTVYFPSGDCQDQIPFSVTLDPNESIDVCAANTGELFQVQSGDVKVVLANCTECTACMSSCESWVVYSLNNADNAVIGYVNCSGVETGKLVSGGELNYFCTQIGAPAPFEFDTNLFTIQKIDMCGCCPLADCVTWTVSNTNDSSNTTNIEYTGCDGELRSYPLQGGVSMDVCIKVDNNNNDSVPYTNDQKIIWSVKNICECTAPDPPEPIVPCEYFENVNVYTGGSYQTDVSPVIGKFPLVLQGNNWVGTTGNRCPRFKNVNALTSDPFAILMAGQTYYVRCQLSQVYGANINLWLGCDFGSTTSLAPNATILGSTTAPQEFYITYSPVNVGANNFGNWLKLTSGVIAYNGTLTIEIGIDSCPQTPLT